MRHVLLAIPWVLCLWVATYSVFRFGLEEQDKRIGAPDDNFEQPSRDPTCNDKVIECANVGRAALRSSSNSDDWREYKECMIDLELMLCPPEDYGSVERMMEVLLKEMADAGD